METSGNETFDLFDRFTQEWEIYEQGGDVAQSLDSYVKYLDGAFLKSIYGQIPYWAKKLGDAEIATPFPTEPANREWWRTGFDY
ncbi:hypothetical protein [Okeania sp. KiyG1]|uniref:hypothetical protein n=1 Tax=Okeania sp. KiyG1 TaxID=2720165 RepID=UPI0019205B3F|nr:hypothetical protein [Okeania sp. KiyG1]GGA15287.1 hypothetical protein CYANOKiyG1_29180 [Okeania sp. KiyG1]